MTITNTTPTVWIAGTDARQVQSFQQRIEPFARGHELDVHELLRSPLRVVHDVASHATAWLVVMHRDRCTAELHHLAAQCRQSNLGFRCMVLVPEGVDLEVERGFWPDESIFLPESALSTTIIDRLRSETHANRIANHRRRQIERLRHRSA